MRRRKRYFDLIKQIPLAAGFLSIAGAVTYLIIMLLRWLADFSGTEGLGHTVLFGAAVAVGFVLYVGAAWVYMQKIGSNDVEFLKSKGVASSDMKPEMVGAGVAFAVSLMVYALVLWLMSLADLGILSGPAAYIALALNLRWGTPFDGVLFWCKAVGFITCAVFLFPAMLHGYKKGFDRKTDDQ